MRHLSSGTCSESARVTILSRVKRLLPAAAQEFITRARNQQAQKQYAHLSLAETFTRIYESGVWAEGGWDGKPCSGPGSNGLYLERYCQMVKGQIEKLEVSSMADLGCGDCNVGKVLADMVASYTGVDISAHVVVRNTQAYASDRIRFVRGDLTADLSAGDLPPADMAVVRQVLQHLSNAEVQLALQNIRRTYPLVLITEHVYVGPSLKPNVDIHHGPRTRVPYHSGVFIDQPPFNVPSVWISDIPYAKEEVLRTWLIDHRTGISGGGSTR